MLLLLAGDAMLLMKTAFRGPRRPRGRERWWGARKSLSPQKRAGEPATPARRAANGTGRATASPDQSSVTIAVLFVPRIGASVTAPTRISTFLLFFFFRRPAKNRAPLRHCFGPDLRSCEPPFRD